jgi:hypothetical protein
MNYEARQMGLFLIDILVLHIKDNRLLLPWQTEGLH